MIKKGTKLRCIREEENITKGKIYEVEFLLGGTFKYVIREDDNELNQYSERGIKMFFEVVNNFKEGDIVKVMNLKNEYYEVDRNEFNLGEILTIERVDRYIYDDDILFFKEKNRGLLSTQVEKVDVSNLKLTFKELINRELEENEEWCSDNYIVKLWGNGRFSIKRKDGGATVAFWNDQETFKYKKIVKPISFQDAFKEYINGKAIRPECNSEVVFKINGGVNTGNITSISKEEIESKWFILG